MFQIGYCPGTRELIPSGWNTVDEEKSFPPLFTRNNQDARAFSDTDLNEDGSDGKVAGSETSEDDSTKFSTITRMNDESESEDDLLSSHVTQVRKFSS